MSYITSVSHGNYKDVARRQYLTTAAYDTYIYQHTITTNQQTAQTSGVLQNLNTVNSTLYNSSTCPANRALIENGKKLFPNTALGVYQYMVGVYDPISFTSGFIDPNDEIFAVLNTDKPGYLGRATDSVTGSSTTGEKAPPVYTDGTVTAGGAISAGGAITAGTGVVATTGQIRAATVTTLSNISQSSGSTAQTITINPTLGQVFIQTLQITGSYSGTVTVTTSANPAVGSVVYLILKTSSTGTLIDCNVSAGTNVKMSTVALGTTNSKTFGLTFVSDGTNLIQVGGGAIAPAM